jgi:hypothetical protein
VTRGMGMGLGVPSAQRLCRGVQGRGSPAKWGAAATSTLGEGGSCSPDESARGCWPRRPNVAQRMTGETMAGQGCSTDGTTGWRGTWASGSAQPSPGHGERAAWKRAVERGKKKRAHLDGRAAALRRDVAPAAVRRVGGRDRGEKVGDGRKKLRVGRLFSLKFRTGVTKKKHRGRPDAWDRLKRRRWALHTLGADAYAQRALAGGAVGRAGPSGGCVLGALARSRWAAGRRALGCQGWAAARSGAGAGEHVRWARRAGKLGRGAGALAWELGRGASGPTREGGGRWAEWGERGEKRRGWAGRMGQERGGWATSLSFYFRNCFSLFFFFTPFDSNPNMPQFQISTLKHMHQIKVKFRVQHDATFHTPLEFSLLDYNYIYK